MFLLIPLELVALYVLHQSLANKMLDICPKLFDEENKECYLQNISSNSILVFIKNDKSNKWNK